MADLRDFTGKNRKFTGTIGERISTGTTAERDTATFGSGTLRFNSSTSLLEYYDGTAWREVRDLNNVITTQGDVLYKDGSGLARLSAGTSGQFLKTNGSGANPSWANTPNNVIQVRFFNRTDAQIVTGTTAFYTIVSHTITPTLASSRILVMASCSVATAQHATVRLLRDGNLIGQGDGAGSRNTGHMNIYSNADGGHANRQYPMINLDHPNTTSAVTYTAQVGTPYTSGWTTSVNRSINDSDNQHDTRTSSSMTLMEIAVGAVT
jgi:hypothetical protein